MGTKQLITARYASDQEKESIKKVFSFVTGLAIEADNVVLQSSSRPATEELPETTEVEDNTEEVEVLGEQLDKASITTPETQLDQATNTTPEVQLDQATNTAPEVQLDQATNTAPGGVSDDNMELMLENALLELQAVKTERKELASALEERDRMLEDALCELAAVKRALREATS